MGKWWDRMFYHCANIAAMLGDAPAQRALRNRAQDETGRLLVLQLREKQSRGPLLDALYSNEPPIEGDDTPRINLDDVARFRIEHESDSNA